MSRHLKVRLIESFLSLTIRLSEHYPPALTLFPRMVDFGRIYSLPSTRFVTLSIVNGALETVRLLDVALREPNSAITIDADTSREILPAHSVSNIILRFSAEKINAITSGTVVAHLLDARNVHQRFELPYRVLYSLGSLLANTSQIRLHSRTSCLGEHCTSTNVLHLPNCKRDQAPEQHGLRIVSQFPYTLNVFAIRSDDAAVYADFNASGTPASTFLIRSLP
jgi:hypothetical protein